MIRRDACQPASFQHGMHSYDAALIENAYHIGQLLHFDDAARAVGHAVVVAANRDEPIVTNAALQLQQRVEWRELSPILGDGLIGQAAAVAG